MAADPIGDLLAALTALEQAGAAGTTTDEQIIDYLLALARARSTIGPELADEATDAWERRLSTSGWKAYRRALAGLVEPPIIEHPAAALPSPGLAHLLAAATVAGLLVIMGGLA